MADKVTQIDLINLNTLKGQEGHPPEDVGGKGSPSGIILSAQQRRSKKKPLTIGVLGVIVLASSFLGAGYFGYLPFLGISKQQPSLEASPKKSGIGETLKLNPLIINLNEANGRHYLKVTIVLEVDDKKWVERIQQRVSVFSDMVILILSDKTLEDMRANDFKERLREELLKEFNGSLGAEGIRRIYFDEFLFQ